MSIYELTQLDGEVAPTDVTPSGNAEYSDALQRIELAFQTYGNGLFTLTSAGVDSALLIDLVSRSGHSIDLLHINTGFLTPETIPFRDSLVEKYGLRLHEFGPSEEEVRTMSEMQLWQTDPEEYSRVTKLEPLTRAIQTLGVTALLSGIRRDQTSNRAEIGVIDTGNDGETRIHPVIDWDQAAIDDYFSVNGLPRHPLYEQGYGSVGDAHTTFKGKNREGRVIDECGIHVVGGVVIRNRLAT